MLQIQCNCEFWFFLFVCVISGVVLIFVQFGVFGVIDLMIFVIGGGFVVFVFVLYIVLCFVVFDVDLFVVLIVMLFIGFGIVMIYWIDIVFKNMGWNVYFIKQLVWIVIFFVGVIVVVILLCNYCVLFWYMYIFGFVGILFLLFLFIFGLWIFDVNVVVWVLLGGVFVFQFGEFVKICFVIFFVGYLVCMCESFIFVGKKVFGIMWLCMWEFGFVFVVWIILFGIIVFQCDFGIGMFIFGMFVVMFYVVIGKMSWVFIGLIFVVVGVVVVMQIFSYVYGCFINWFFFFDVNQVDLDGVGYQFMQGLFGLVCGGFIGIGWGQGCFEVILFVYSDYIIMSLGEEFGLIGLFVIFCLYMVFVSCGMCIGFVGQDDFGKLFVIGLLFMIVLQVFIMVGGVIWVIFLMGLIILFFVVGGFFFVVNWFIVVLLLCIFDGVCC